MTFDTHSTTELSDGKFSTAELRKEQIDLIITGDNFDDNNRISTCKQK